MTKSFGKVPVLRNVSLTIADGEFLSLLGPSGCGKTTLLRILAGLEPQDTGEIRIGGRCVDDDAPKSRDIAMVFQSYALYPYMTVAQNIGLPLEMRRLSRLQRLPLVGSFVLRAKAVRADIRADVLKAAESLGIAHLLERRPAQLSGGQRQRVALARAMVRRPSAFLMDEPLSNLDAKLRVKARTEISDLRRRLGSTFVYVTHDQTEAMTMSDRVAVMLEGRIVQVASPQTLYDDPAELAVAAFVGTPDINVLQGVLRSEGMIDVLGVVLPCRVSGAVGTPVQVAIRPESWAIEVASDRASRRASDRAGTGSFAARVRHIEHLGSETLVHCILTTGAAEIVARVAPNVAVPLQPGTEVAATPHAGAVLCFAKSGTRMRDLRMSDNSENAALAQAALANG